MCCRQELRDRIAEAGSSAQLGPADEVLRGLPVAWVLIFNHGRNDEGVYTLQGRSTPVSSYVLAFEQTDEAERFAQLLQVRAFATTGELHLPRACAPTNSPPANLFTCHACQAEGFDLPEPMQWQADQIRTFCEMGQFQLGVVPTVRKDRKSVV